MRPGLHWPMLPWIYVRAAACAATNHAPLDPSAIMDQQALDRRAQAQSATTGSRRGPISKKVVTFSNSKPGSSASAPGGNRSTNDSSPIARDDACERRSRTHVGAVTETEVLVGVVAIGGERLGVSEHLLVSVRAASADDDPLAGTERDVGDARVVHTSPCDEQDGWVEAQAFLDHRVEP